MTTHKRWEQLKVVQGKDGSLVFDGATARTIAEIAGLADNGYVTIECIGWAGWELVAVANNSMYYKREWVGLED